MTGRPTFGDFLDAARRSVEHRPGEPPPARGNAEETTRSLLRVVTLLARYAHDTTPAFTRDPSTVWATAAADARQALANAIMCLRMPGGSQPGWPPAPSASQLARRLDQTAVSLAAGRDLLHTHLALGPTGGQVPRSPWASILASERVNRALLGELAALAQPIARYGATVALAPAPGTPLDAGQRRHLNAACQWLWAFTAAVNGACREQPVPATDAGLLVAIPANALPARPAQAAAQTVPGLCDAVITTAERARHLAWQAAQQPPGSPAFTIAALRQTAEASTLASHHCALLAATLAARTGHAAVTADLAAAAQAARHAAATWYQTAKALRHVTTDTRHTITPAAAEARDLAWWTGRLAHTGHTWTLVSGPAHPTRSPRDLAPEPTDIPHAVAAIHHAADALAMLAGTEHRQLSAATQARRILVPTRTLTADWDIPRPYTPASPRHTAALLTHYQRTAQAGQQATAAFGRAAYATNAPSHILTTAYQATYATPTENPTLGPTRHGQHEREKPADPPGPLEATLHDLGITSPALLTRGADLDHASQHLLIEAAEHLPPAHQRPATPTLNETVASAALLNHALATGQPQTAQLLRPPNQARYEQPQPELEAEP